MYFLEKVFKIYNFKRPFWQCIVKTSLAIRKLKLILLKVLAVDYNHWSPKLVLGLFLFAQQCVSLVAHSVGCHSSNHTRHCGQSDRESSKRHTRTKEDGRTWRASQKERSKRGRVCQRQQRLLPGGEAVLEATRKIE